MPTSRSYIKEWEDRELDDLSVLKDPTLSDVVNDATVDWSYVTKPRHHQRVANAAAMIEPFLYVAYDMGLGKSKIALDTFRNFKLWGIANKVLVLTPNVVALYSWVEQIKIHAPDLSCVVLQGGSWDERLVWLREHDVVIATYIGLVAWLSELKEVDTGKRKYKVNAGRLRAVREQVDYLIVDEATAIKNHRSASYKVCKAIRQDCVGGVLLSGTPVGRDPHDLWSQYYVIDGGATLGPTLTFFRDVFFTKVFKQLGGGFFDYTFIKKKLGPLRRMLSSKSVRYKAEECVDLPPCVTSAVVVDNSPRVDEHYNALVNKLRKAKGDYQVIDSAFTRLRMMCSGFVSVKDDELDTRDMIALVPEEENPKLLALGDIMDRLLEQDEKMLVFNHFVYTGDMLVQWARDRGKGHGSVRLYGGMTATQKKDAVESFKNDRHINILFANLQSASMVLNLQHCRYIVFFELPVSPIQRAQALKRCHRMGQTRKVFVYDLIVKGSIEEKILKYLGEGRDLLRALVDGDTI